jgi:hypothetical protein
MYAFFSWVIVLLSHLVISYHHPYRQ